jgi:hypothetical protein
MFCNKRRGFSVKTVVNLSFGSLFACVVFWAQAFTTQIHGVGRATPRNDFASNGPFTLSGQTTGQGLPDFLAGTASQFGL